MERAGQRAGRAVRWGRRVGASPDAPLVAGLLLVLLVMVEVSWRGVQPGQNLVAVLLLAVGATAPLVVVRRYPAIVAATITAACMVGFVVQPPTIAGTVALAVSHHAAGRRVRPTVSAGLVLPILGYAVLPYGWGRHAQSFAVLLLALVATAAATGIAWRTREQAAAHDASREVLRGTLLEHAAQGERVRIARELHDVVAHHVSMIAFQAETARLTTPGMPDEGGTRLSAIADTARTALTEMRRLMGVLRADAGTGPAARAPQPGLRELIDLVNQARASTGAAIRLIVRGHVVALDPGVQLSAYRIIQEALTNARRHAPGSAVDVVLDYGPDSLRVSIRDNGPGAAGPDPSGHGLLGMRERATMLGGAICTGPAPGSGFLVEAELPLPEAAPLAATGAGAAPAVPAVSERAS